MVLNGNPGSPTCWGKSTSQRLGFLICQTGAAGIRRHHTDEVLSTWTAPSEWPCSSRGPAGSRGHAHQLAMPLSLIKKGRWQGGDRDWAGKRVPGGAPAWDAGNKTQFQGWGGEPGGSPSESVRAEKADSRDRRSCPRLGFSFASSLCFFFCSPLSGSTQCMGGLVPPPGACDRKDNFPQLQALACWNPVPC